MIRPGAWKAPGPRSASANPAWSVRNQKPNVRRLLRDLGGQFPTSPVVVRRPGWTRGGLPLVQPQGGLGAACHELRCDYALNVCERLHATPLLPTSSCSQLRRLNPQQALRATRTKNWSSLACANTVALSSASTAHPGAQCRALEWCPGSPFLCAFCEGGVRLFPFYPALTVLGAMGAHSPAAHGEELAP